MTRRDLGLALLAALIGGAIAVVIVVTWVQAVRP